ncbi:MAG: HAD family hydrolase [Terriglobia bacterium]
MSKANGARLGLLIFDLDGTLIDSETDLAASVNATRRHLALDPLPREMIAGYVGHGVVTLVRRALGAETPPEAVESAVSYFLDYYREHMLDHTLLYPGVRDTLGALEERKLAVLTNKPVNFSRQILEGLGVASRFAYVYGGNSFDLKKPDPVGIFRLMEDTGIPPGHTMMIGDSDTDIHTGRNAGVWTCAVTYGIGSHTLANAASDFVLHDFRELLSLVDGGCGGLQDDTIADHR